MYESFKTFKTKLLTFFSNEIIECNYKINQYTVDLNFLEYSMKYFMLKNLKNILIVFL